MRGRIGAGGLAIVILVIAVVVGLREERDAPRMESVAPGPGIEVVAPSVPAAIEVPAAPEPLEAVREALPPVTRRALPASADDPCAPIDEDAPSVARPSMTQVLEARQSELAARARALGRVGSPALREGIELLVRGGDPEAAIALIVRAPDRTVDDFDHAAAAALHAGLAALSEGRLREAERWGRRATSLAREDPAGPVLRALVALREDDEVEALTALGEALTCDPEEPGVAWALGARLARTENLEGAEHALGTYVEAVPGDLGARRLLARVRRQASAIADTSRRERRGVVMRAPRSLDAAIVDRSLAIVDGALDEAARWTRTTRAPALLVIVHRDRAAMQAATCAPAWSGALFDGALHVDMETLRGPEDRMRIALRHESLHAQLHARPGRGARRAPYWLDEGMAQRFAGEESPEHHRSWAMMVRSRVWIPMDSIAGSFLDIDDPTDARLAYHQSLAMVRYLEARHGERAIARAIAAIDEGTSPERLLGAIAPELDGARLLAFLSELEAR